MNKKEKEVSNSLMQVGKPALAKYSSTLAQRGLALIDSTINIDWIRLLIVDDIPEVRERIRQYIEAAKNIWVVGEASNGLEAVEMYDELKPDVVSMNIHMPVMDGLTATAIICKKHKEAKIFIFSVDDTYQRRAKIAGALDYILKPCTASELIETINKLTGRHHSEIESNQESA